MQNYRTIGRRRGDGRRRLHSGRKCECKRSSAGGKPDYVYDYFFFYVLYCAHFLLYSTYRVGSSTIERIRKTWKTIPDFIRTWDAPRGGGENYTKAGRSIFSNAVGASDSTKYLLYTIPQSALSSVHRSGNADKHD